VGQVGNLRPIGNRPRAGPEKFLRVHDQPRFHRVHFDIAYDSVKLRLIAHQPVIAFVLPKRLTGESEYLVALPGCESLERLHRFGNIGERGNEQMNVIRHDDKGVEIVVSRDPIPVVDGFENLCGDFRAAEVQRSGTGIVQQTVHSEKCLSGSRRRRKGAA